MPNSSPGFTFGQVPSAAEWNNAFAAKLDASGGEVTGPFELAQDPTTALQAVTKQYADAISTVANAALPKAGGAMTGPVTSSASGVALSFSGTGAVKVPAGTTAQRPDSGNAAEVRYNSTTGHPEVGVGGSWRTVTAPTFNICDSGAAGDGVADDQPVIQAWLNSIAASHVGAEVVLEPGKFYYIHAAPLTVPSNVTIRGAYNAQDNQLAAGTFFGGGGFKIDPTLPCGIIMGAASALKSLKVYRSGLVANASTATATSAYAAWAAEAFYLATNGVMAANATTIPLASTTGITVGMTVTGPGGIGPGSSAPTVTAVNAGVSVTISGAGVNASQPSGTYFRFGGSTGIQIPYSTSGVILEDLTIIGFRTGIQTFPGQFWISRIHGDCITNIECTNGGDTAYVGNCEFLPLYGSLTGNASRNGDAVFVHDGGVTVNFFNTFSFGWTVGWHVYNAVGTVFVDCNAEALGVSSFSGLTNWLIEFGSQISLISCHAQGAGTGFHINGSALIRMMNCDSSGSQPTGTDNVAHFLIEGTAAANFTGDILNPSTLSGYPNKVPVKFGSNISWCNFINPSIDDFVVGAGSTTVPFIQGTLPNSVVPKFDAGSLYSTVGSGSTIVAQPYYNGLICGHTATVAALTVTLPPFPMDRQTFKMTFNSAITTLTINTSDASAVGNYSNPGAGSVIEAVYVAAANKWFFGS